MVDFARAAKVNRVLGYLPGCIGAPSTRTEPCLRVDECLQCWARAELSTYLTQPPTITVQQVDDVYASTFGGTLFNIYTTARDRIPKAFFTERLFVVKAMIRAMLQTEAMQERTRPPYTGDSHG